MLGIIIKDNNKSKQCYIRFRASYLFLGNLEGKKQNSI